MPEFFPALKDRQIFSNSVILANFKELGSFSFPAKND